MVRWIRQCNNDKSDNIIDNFIHKKRPLQQPVLWAQYSYCKAIKTSLNCEHNAPIVKRLIHHTILIIELKEEWISQAFGQWLTPSRVTQDRVTFGVTLSAELPRGYFGVTLYAERVTPG